ncbi:MAG: AsmA family protein [Spartobacteria bacterium]|nr:AsmA family protein [Spartobacteria bacterium]
MKKVFKIIAAIIVVVLLLLVGANVYLKHYLNSTKFRTAVAELVENATHREMTLGQISYTLFPPSIVVRDVALKEKDLSQNFIALQEFSFHVDWAKREVTRILLKEPSIRIVEHADGTFNFSDMIPEQTAETTAEQPQAQATSAPETVAAEEKPPTELKEADLPFSIALIQIEKASFTLVKEMKDGDDRTFTIPSLDFSIRDIGLNKPIQIDLDMKIGAESSLKATTALGPMRTNPPDIANMKIALDGVFDLTSFKDLEAFITAEDLAKIPMTSMDFLWKGEGTLASGFQFDLNVETPPVGGRNQLFLDLQNSLTLSLPEATLNHVLYGMPLPADMVPPSAPRVLQDGEICLASDPMIALLLSTLQAQTRITTPKLAYMQNECSDLDVNVVLKNGIVRLNPLTLSLYSGSINGLAEINLNEYPTTYRLEPFDIKHVELASIVKANPDLAKGAFVQGLSGQLDVHADLSGQGFSTNNLKQFLKANGNILLAGGQSVSTGGRFLDRLYLKLDDPILISVLPELAPRIALARSNETTVSTTKLEHVVFDFNMKTGSVNVTDFRAGTPDYILSSAGIIKPFDDYIRMEAQLNLSSNVTMELTDGKDRSDRLPYENDGLMIPIIISGSLQSPKPLPDISRIIQTITTKRTQSSLNELIMKNTNEDDCKEIQKGLNLFKGLLGGEK